MFLIKPSKITLLVSCVAICMLSGAPQAHAASFLKKVKEQQEQEAEKEAPVVTPPSQNEEKVDTGEVSPEEDAEPSNAPSFLKKKTEEEKVPDTQEGQEAEKILDDEPANFLGGSVIPSPAPPRMPGTQPDTSIEADSEQEIEEPKEPEAPAETEVPQKEEEVVQEPPISSEEPKESPRSQRGTANFVVKTTSNVRSQPNTKGAILGKLRPGDVIASFGEVQDSSGREWLQFQMLGSGIDAYIAKFLTMSETQWNDLQRVEGAFQKLVNTGSIVVSGQNIDLYGLRGVGGSIAGQATVWLAKYSSLTCDRQDTLDYICMLPGGENVNKVMLENGFAYAASGAPTEYSRLVAGAKSQRRGVWAVRSAPQITRQKTQQSTQQNTRRQEEKPQTFGDQLSRDLEESGENIVRDFKKLFGQ